LKLVAYLLAAVLAGLGLLFILGNQGVWARIVVGALLLVAGGALAWFARQQVKAAETTIVQKIDLSGDVHLESLTCRSCGGTLSRKSISVEAGAVMVHCEYCGAVYQIEEAPKW